jgi:hypothetical protein
MGEGESGGARVCEAGRVIEAAAVWGSGGMDWGVSEGGGGRSGGLAEDSGCSRQQQLV